MSGAGVLAWPLRAMVEEQAEHLAEIGGVEAVWLGGSHARGRARPDSDVDLALLYSDRAPLDLDALRALARDGADAPPEVVEPYAWGPWVNGGAWLVVGGQRVDWIYRRREQLTRVIEDALAGRHELHWGQQPPFGFASETYLGELRVARALRDPAGHLAALQARIAD